MLWISPLIIMGSIRSLNEKATLLNDPARGDWRRLVLAATAALVCGFFWEMWNLLSLEKWIYTVPFVGRFHVFEMPLLGYAGYLPFGIECALIAELVGLTGKEQADLGYPLDRRIDHSGIPSNRPRLHDDAALTVLSKEWSSRKRMNNKIPWCTGDKERNPNNPDFGSSGRLGLCADIEFIRLAGLESGLYSI